ncbi:hypothetical protein [Extensimonas vulgaris]|uniref:hypothetical protein n=1 Tax=Extensimonas vulgaris TaxID=1031594 RepID=UPI0018F4D3CF|nr:hypothetical protein [Extensimonas vulgaris]
MGRGFDGHVSLHETQQQLRHFCRGGFVPADFAVFVGPRQTGAELAFTIDEPAEFDVVGQDQVGQRLAVAAQLRGFGSFVEMDAHVLGLDVTQRQHAARDDEVGRAAIDALGLVGSLYGALGVLASARTGLRAHGFEQRLERRAVRVLGGIADLERGGDGL